MTWIQFIAALIVWTLAVIGLVVVIGSLRLWLYRWKWTRRP